MKSRIISFQFILLNFCLMLLAGCLDEIDAVITETVDGGLAIQGQIVKGNPSVVDVTIQTLFDFKKQARFEKVKEVLIIDDAGNELPLETNKDGVFSLEIPDNHPYFKVEHGKSYGISVTTLEDKTYVSTLERLYPVPAINSLDVEKVQVSRENNQEILRPDTIINEIDAPMAFKLDSFGCIIAVVPGVLRDTIIQDTSTISAYIYHIDFNLKPANQKENARLYR